MTAPSVALFQKVNVKILTFFCENQKCSLGKPPSKKNGKKKGTLSPLGNPPPKRVKRGHLLSDYRQKCVNATRDSRHFDVKSA